VPIESTYRLQFHAGFTFRDAAAVVPYLARLGVTHVYASPYLKARPGSTHGYDVVDHSKLNPELGTQADFDAFCAALQQHGMSHILDIVPNHVGVATNDNKWWNDVLENGPASRYAGYFDITWRGSPRPELHDKVLLPVLGEPYGDVLDKGQLRLAFEDGAFGVYYYDRRLPISPRTYAKVLLHRIDELEQSLRSENLDLLEYQSIANSCRYLPDRSTRDEDDVLQRWRESQVIKRRLGRLAGASEPIFRHIEANVAAFNAMPDLLDELLDRQCYRLSFWHVASDEINYRRFFDINDLAALSMERREVFEATHAFVLQLLRDGKLAGVRVDHPDGLYDPKQYFERLSEAGADFVVAEKILAVNEPLPPDWPVNGTSGYDALNMINGLFVDRANEEAFTRLYQEFAGDTTPYADLVYRSKLLILEISLASELQMLAYQLDRIAQRGRRTRDFTHNTLRHALREVIACFPVYRSYVCDQGVRDADVKVIDAAIERAVARNPKVARGVFDFVRDVLLLRSEAASRESQRRFAGKFQQLTAPVTAKGTEDTAFYIYNRLISLNEVGGEPAHFGVSPAELHAYLKDRQGRWPLALTALSTHDTKRSEDVRARINVLSEMPDEWRECVTQWADINRHDGPPCPPGRNEEYLLYQTLLGAWPLEEEADDAFVGRIQAYMQKASREAKVNTSWTSPNAEYESAVESFVASTIRNPAFLDSFLPFQRHVANLAMTNTLAQTLLRLTVPGVPDTYQGTELLDLSLVDPDNRRPVDYQRRWQLLEQPEQDRKFFVTMKALHARREHVGLFSRGDYTPLEAKGPKTEHVFAFERRLGVQQAVVVVPRLITRVGDWADTTIRLPNLRGRNVFTGTPFNGKGGDVPVGELLSEFPVVLLIADA
jgi:(1->4)-alpha-D-glucan 1-alpha-D-glucosylmutase